MKDEPSSHRRDSRKYVKGEAKEVVESFLLLDSEDAYDKAKETLKKRFGDPFAERNSKSGLRSNQTTALA